MFQIRAQHSKANRYVNSLDTSRSNWLRFVNYARNYDEQNLMVFQFAGAIYYRSYVDIPPDVELLGLCWDSSEDQHSDGTRQIATERNFRSHWCQGIHVYISIYA